MNSVSRNFFSILITFIIFITLSGCSFISQPSIVEEETAPTPSNNAGYRIGVDDQLQVNVWHNPDLSVHVPVRPDGKITVPLIGDIQAGGRTPEQVANSISTALSAYVREPQVTVIVTELRSHEYLSRVRVTGAVRQPISLPFRQGMTVLDAVLAAGGITEFASPDRTKLYRKSNKGVEEYSVRLQQILSRGDVETNYTLMPGDIISIPERLF
jgi:polysaccharide export outer membrane protein